MHSQPPNPSTPQNRFDQVRQQLENYPQHAGNDAPPSDLADAIDAERQDAVRRGDQDWANQAWCLEQVHRVQQAYGRAFSELKHHEFYKAWCSLEESEIALVQLAPHPPIDDRYGLRFIEQKISALQALFPYQTFVSRVPRHRAALLDLQDANTAAATLHPPQRQYLR